MIKGLDAWLTTPPEPPEPSPMSQLARLAFEQLAIDDDTLEAIVSIIDEHDAWAEGIYESLQMQEEVPQWKLDGLKRWEEAQKAAKAELQKMGQKP